MLILSQNYGENLEGIVFAGEYPYKIIKIEKKVWASYNFLFLLRKQFST